MFKLFHQFNGLIRCALVLMCLTAALLLQPASARAGGTVTTLDALALETAIAGGGLVTIAVDGTITETNIIFIETNVVINATGHTVTLSGGGATQLFFVDNGWSLTVSNLTITSGSSTGAVGVAGAQGANGSSTGQTGGNGGIGSDRQGRGGVIHSLAPG